MDAERYVFVRRKVFGIPFAFKNSFFAPVGNSVLLAEYKAALYRSGANIRFDSKVGSVGSGSRLGQVAQAAGTISLPGNLSAVRSPVRSGLTRALTPGAGKPGVNIPSPNERGYRCSEGFQFGGRFTDENYSTCGKQIFDIASLKETLSQALFRTRTRRQRAPKTASGSGEVLRGQQVGEDTQLMITRSLRVSEVGALNDQAKQSSISAAVEAIANQDSDSSVLVRRDGLAMVPVVPIEELRKIPDNRNMEEAAFVKSVRSAEELGSEELGLLSNTGVTSLVYVTPNGVQIRIDRTRDLSTGERRQLGKDANTAAEMPVDEDSLARLNFIVENTDGAFEMSFDYGDVENPENEGEGGLPNWAIGAFVDAPETRVEDPGDMSEDEPVDQPGAPSAQDAEVTEEDESASASVAPPPLEQRISSLAAAVEHLTDGGMISEISPSIVHDALKRANNYEETRLSDDLFLYESSQDGRRVLFKESETDFEHLSQHFSGEVLRNLGVQSPAVRFAGSGNNRPYYFRSPDDVVQGAVGVADYEPSVELADQVLGVQISDWLTDTRDRSESSLFVADLADGGQELVASYGPSGALIGLDSDELESRRNETLEVFFQLSQDAYGVDLTEAEESQQEVVLRLLDSLITRAQEFSWADYLQKLQLDGSITDQEKRHMNIVRDLYDNRLQSLTNSRDVVLEILGM